MKAARILTVEDFKIRARTGTLDMENHGIWRACSVHGDFEIYTFPMSNADLHMISVWHPENIADEAHRKRSVQFKQNVIDEIIVSLVEIPVGTTHMGFMPSQFDLSLGASV
jgi:hypothetical protein